jgi:hypothetical protein
MDRNICPSPSFLSHCSLNAITQHYVCCCLLEVLKKAPLTCLAFITWIGRHARARIVDASFISNKTSDTANLDDDVDKGTFNPEGQTSESMDIDDLINQDSPFVLLKKGSMASTLLPETHVAGATSNTKSDHVRNTTTSDTNNNSSKTLTFITKSKKSVPSNLVFTPISASNILATKDTMIHDEHGVEKNASGKIKTSNNNLSLQLDKTVEFPLFLHGLQTMFMTLGNNLHVTCMLDLFNQIEWVIFKFSALLFKDIYIYICIYSTIFLHLDRHASC